MEITVVFDAICSFDIKVPEGTTEEEAKVLAAKWFDEHFYEVDAAIADSEIDIREVSL